MTHKQISLKALTSVAVIAAVIFSLNASGQSISLTALQTTKATGINITESTNDHNIVVSQAEINNTMIENAQKIKEPVLEWFKENSWFKNCIITPSASINLNELKKYYAANPTYWEKTFEYIKKTDLLNLAVGKYPVDGDKVLAVISEYDTQEPAERKWESHKKFIDIQIILSGKELMGVAPYAEATPDIPYSETKDVEFRQVINGKDHLAQPGTFFIFFPSDSHRPNQNAGEIVKVKKAVFKVATN